MATATPLLRSCDLPSRPLLLHRPGRALSPRLPPPLLKSSRPSRAVAAATATATEGLKKGIAELYDESSGIWESLWGDHMHHGFYEPQASPESLSDHRAAQIRMIEESLSFAGVPDDPLKKPKRIVDVGCGIGGSSRYLAKKYGAKCQGITLSTVQAQRAQALAISEGLADHVSFQVADALEQPFPDGQFDLVWSMESGEHMPDKAKERDEGHGGLWCTDDCDSGGTLSSC